VPRRDWKILVTDILEAITTINEYTEGMAFEAFKSDSRTVDAVIRNLTVIGEAASHVPEDIVLANPGIPWRDMRDMRNFVVHEYFGISNRIIWDTLQNNLPPLVPLLKPLLE